ncbi:hydrolase [Telmatospirillum sp.]|uniref:hydrolase n=1 Tax=Telmatospirillum sp. TaxID=2079197 RepID=UPI00284441D0|nr:hydrolase [Telmatospirillum sp.]MDR3439211.1 hydrolase [Telmatospirillum sp.]
MLMRAEHSNLLIVDVQERLAPVMSDPRRVINGCALLMRAAQRLGVPITVSEQYPKGIGATIFDLREWIPAEGAIAKLHFSCVDEPAIVGRLDAGARRQVVIAGIEAHICVLQSALGFKDRGYDVFVVTDACASRRPENEEAAWLRLREAGVATVTAEMVLFEWLCEAGTPEFKELVALVK